MKPFIALLLAFLSNAILLTAQSGKQIQDIPQLQEWWRADNMGYGVPHGRDDNGGMTWLDNFYNGKGALVVSTPEGVKTWQMRFPGDTANVFTWRGRGGLWRTIEGANPHIYTGDFNGDKRTDYIDAWGNIYQGIENGQPPQPLAQFPIGYLFPRIITDINGDGLDDIINPSVGNNQEMAVVLGNLVIGDMRMTTLPIAGIDSNNSLLTAYTVAPKEIRVLCRSYYWHYNKQLRIIDRDGYRLVRIWWDGSGFQSQVLDEFTVNTQDGTGLYWLGALMQQPNGKTYWLGASQIQGQSVNTDLAIYDLSNNKIEKLHTTRIDSIAALGVLNHSIDKDSLPDVIIRYTQKNGYSDINFYSGSVQQNLFPIGRYNVCQRTLFYSIPSSEQNVNNLIAISGNSGACFRIITLKDIVGVDESDNTEIHVFESITPQPIRFDQLLQIRVAGQLHSKGTILLYSYTGERICTIAEVSAQVSEQILNIPLSSCHLRKGIYWLTLMIGNKQAQIKLIITE